MEQFIIEGGIPLSGTVQPAGNKNAALPMLAACLLTEDPVILHNIPNIKDVESMRLLLECMGASIMDIGQNSC
jgi:UDP-N-acetylglucosamine 1-carboxyvinyltransferase